MKFHHYGLLSANPEATREILCGMGYTVAAPVHDPLQNVLLFWGSHELLPPVEIIAPAETSGAVSKLQKTLKQGVYHLCFEVDDLAADLAKLGEHGRVLPVSPPQPAVLFGGRKVSFHFVENFGLIELLEPS